MAEFSTLTLHFFAVIQSCKNKKIKNLNHHDIELWHYDLIPAAALPLKHPYFVKDGEGYLHRGSVINYWDSLTCKLAAPGVANLPISAPTIGNTLLMTETVMRMARALHCYYSKQNDPILTDYIIGHEGMWIADIPF